MNNPLVSVIIPTHNRAGMIQRAVNSALEQTYKNLEIIVVDDASTDNTKEVIDNYRNSKIKYLRLAKNSGQCIARNRGIEISSGEYIGFLDSDDEWLPVKIEKQLECFTKGDPSLAAVYGVSYVVDEVKNHTVIQNAGLKKGDIYNDLLQGYCPSTPTLFLVKSDILREVGMFDESLITFVDLDLWLRFARKFTFDYVDEPVIRKYEHLGEQYVSNFNQRARGLDLLLAKWGPEIRSKFGSPFLIRLKKQRIIKTVENVLLRPSKNYRKSFFNIIRRLIQIKSFNIRLYVKAVVVFLVGPDTMNYYYTNLKKQR